MSMGEFIAAMQGITAIETAKNASTEKPTMQKSEADRLRKALKEQQRIEKENK